MMEVYNIFEISEKWNNLVDQVLDLKPLDELKFAKLLVETYEALRKYDDKNEVPKEICRLFFNMNEWLYFSSLMEEKEVGTDFYNYQASFCIVNAMKNGFLDKGYEHHFAIPKADEIHTINMNVDEITEYLQSVKNKTYKLHAGIRLAGSIL